MNDTIRSTRSVAEAPIATGLRNVLGWRRHVAQTAPGCTLAAPAQSVRRVAGIGCGAGAATIAIARRCAQADLPDMSGEAVTPSGDEDAERIRAMRLHPLQRCRPAEDAS